MTACLLNVFSFFIQREKKTALLSSNNFISFIHFFWLKWTRFYLRDLTHSSLYANKLGGSTSSINFHVCSTQRFSSAFFCTLMTAACLKPTTPFIITSVRRRKGQQVKLKVDQHKTKLSDKWWGVTLLLYWIKARMWSADVSYNSTMVISLH